MPLSLYSVLRSNFAYTIPICNQESINSENFRKLVEMEISLQDAKNIRENRTYFMIEEGDHYLEDSGFVVNRAFKARG